MCARVFVLLRLTVITEAVPAAGYDYSITQQLMTDQADQFVRHGLLHCWRGRLLRDERRPLLLANCVRFTRERKKKFTEHKVYI